MPQTALKKRRRPRRGPNRPRPDWHPDATAQTRFQESLHEPHWSPRATIITALMNASTGYLKAKGLRLASCGSGASFYVEPDQGKVKPWLSRCKDRLCPFCAKARNVSVSTQLEDLMTAHKCDRMIILTTVTALLPLQDEIDFLMKSFRKLRRSKIWRQYVTGGAYVLEITLNPDTRGWHPHLHIAYRGKYFPQALLKTTWREITGGSYIVWVSKINNAQGAAAEMSKYVGKPQRIEEFEPDKIREYALATKGLRMVQTFGDCHNMNVTDEDPGVDKPRTERHVRLSDLLHFTRLGFKSPAHLLALVAKRWAVFGRYINHELPQLAPDDDRANGHEALLRLLRAEGPQQPRSPPPAATVARLDKQIAMAFYAYLADDHRGLFADAPMYYNTRTEYLERTC